ncbi:MAG: hypothetical protein WAO83_20060 [Fuerstiella sp.]
MTFKPTVDHGQQLATPDGQTIGFVDTKEEFDAVTKALCSAGYGKASIVALHLDDGIQLLKRLQEKFFFGDGEDAIIKFALKELRLGHYGLGIEVKNRDGALKVISVAEPLGAHSFSYFGTLVNERLT